MGKTVIIGAGIIGLATAYELAKRGEEVLIIERSAPGSGSSSGNAGWIVPGDSNPLPKPGLTASSLRSMSKRDSPLYIKPRPSPSMLHWLWQFWRNCNQDAYLRGLNALAGLNQSTMALYDEWAQEGVEFEMHCQGLLLAGLKSATVEQFIANDAPLYEALGYQTPSLLTGDEVRQIEPEMSDEVIAGAMLEDERHVRPETLIDGLVQKLAEMNVEILSGVRVTGATVQRTTVTALLTKGGRFEADNYVLAAGAWSGDLSKKIGLSIPIQAGKGYSLTISKPDVTLNYPVLMLDGSAALTPFDGALRVAGTMELSGLNHNLDSVRLRAMWKSAERYLGRIPQGDGKPRAWVGMRPLTWDGLPVIGRMPRGDNLYAATGHQMLGLTLAPSTARALAGLICDGKSTIDIRWFDPARFFTKEPPRALNY